MTDKMIIISAPSGSGKTTLVKYLLSVRSDLEFSVSACSRPPRGAEVNGKDYYFFSPEQFKQKIENNEFIEWEEVYPGFFYGTLRSEIERIWKNHRHVIFDVDVIGGLNLKKLFGPIALAVFIQPPSLEVLEYRLRKRQSDSEETILKRLKKADWEMQFAHEFDTIVVNNEITISRVELEQKVDAFLKER